MTDERKLDEDVKEGTEDDTNAGGVNTNLTGKKNDTKDGAEIIKKRSDGGNEKAALGLKDAGKKGGEGKQKLGQGHDPD